MISATSVSMGAKLVNLKALSKNKCMEKSLEWLEVYHNLQL